MALTLAALLLWGLSGPGGWGCLQCDHLVLAALAELRAVLVPSHFHSPQLQARAQDLLLGMQGPFFRDYALGAFVGMAEVEQLEDVASFLHNQTQLLRDSDLTEGPLLEELVNFREEVIKEFKEVLRAYELKACNPKTCHLLKEVVLDCSNCQKVSPKCIKEKYCFVNRQPRVEFRMTGGYLKTQPLVGICFVVLLALFFFFVMVISAFTYRKNRKLLLH
ncbi:izumo sperm-egg fusion protein 2 [Cavia porcellus]|uniref:izumo sperm-egg fusion protein 2 n=1 Tax=Cavia porcellus TaxID=10141 RepID=UPI000184CEF9